MSSHHFVTDTQSAVLYICGRNIESKLLDQLLEWNPVVIAKAGCCEWLTSLNIKIDCIVTGGDSPAIDLPYGYESWPIGELKTRIKRLIDTGKANRLSIIGPERKSIPGIWADWMITMDFAQTVYAGNAKYFPIQKGETFKKWVADEYSCSLLNQNAKISGDFAMMGDLMRMKSSGWLIVEAKEDVIFVEYN